MARTKEAVETFLELGAKYEVVLVGLADDMLKQRDKIREIDQLANKTAELQADLRTQLLHATERLKRVCMLSAALAAVALVVGVVAILQ